MLLVTALLNLINKKKADFSFAKKKKTMCIAFVNTKKKNVISIENHVAGKQQRIANGYRASVYYESEAEQNEEYIPAILSAKDQLYLWGDTEENF